MDVSRIFMLRVRGGKQEVLTLCITLGMYAITARHHLIGGKTMNDTITQVRLSMRLDAYLRDDTEKNVR
jgi:hypothetical protein